MRPAPEPEKFPESFLDAAMRAHLHRWLRPAGPNQVIANAPALTADYLLSTEGVFFAPGIPPEAQKNATSRFSLTPEPGNRLLCVLHNISSEGRWYDALALLTQGLCGWDRQARRAWSLSYARIAQVYALTALPKRGLKLVLPSTSGERFVELFVHEALLAALCEFLQSASRALEDSKLVLNTATAEVLCQIPGLRLSDAQTLIAARDQRGGFRTLDEAAEALQFGDRGKRLLQLHAIPGAARAGTVRKRVRQLDTG